MTEDVAFNVPALTSAIREELDLIESDPPGLKDVYDGVDKVRSKDSYRMVVDSIRDMVRTIQVQRVIKTTVKEVDTVTGSSCVDELGVQKKIGEGADGAVYLLNGGDRVAKVATLSSTTYRMRNSTVTDTGIIEALCEMHAAKIAGEEGISPKVYDTFLCVSHTTAVYVIVMDNVRGRTLAKWASATPSEHDRKKMSDKLQEAATKLHNLGIYHQDLHANNSIVDDDGRPWIIDFSRCTYLETFKKYQREHNDIPNIQAALASVYIPTEFVELCSYIVSKLIERGIVR